ncbi:MAG: branched-chain amino acid aminotransferase [Balneolaceae bacterium]|nr:branched-chain amino acid aminotransferase [Balneolaceae bacterium]
MKTMNSTSLFNLVRTQQSRLPEVDLENPGFGRIFSDHMLEVEYQGDAWQEGTIKPYGPIQIEPSLNTLHYGQSVFEGTKAYYAGDDTVNLFRLEMNYERFCNSCERMCIPPVDREVFIEGIRELVRLDHEWVPRSPENALYIRPLAFAFDMLIAARVSPKYRFYIITSPVGSYYSDPVRLISSLKYVRAVKGGVGAAKTAANYAASLYPAQKAKAMGYDQVLWLDAMEHRYVEEVGTMNIFFVIDGTLVTAPLGGTILPGVTRDSVLKLARHWDLDVEERPLPIDEVMKAGREGRLQEAFGAGTAAVIAPVGLIHHDGETVEVHEESRGPIGKRLYDAITGIQRGEREDPFGWITTIRI